MTISTDCKNAIDNNASNLRLTEFAKRAGCAAKQAPDYLFALLPTLPAITDPNVLVSSATADDAAIYQISEEMALVLTTDFFTPIVDRPYDFGAIAAANALSDVYAMGGKPLTALSLVGFPDAVLPPEVLRDILRGASAKCAEAGVAIIGGHSIKTDEPIFGLAVVGTIAPARVLANSQAQPGDALILTKPLGLGIITTAAKRGEDVHGAIADAIEIMATLNSRACEAFTRDRYTHALTDITGFGLLGHLRNVVTASNVGARVYLERVPVLPAAWDYVRAGIVPGGTRANHRFLSDCVDYSDSISADEQLILCDAQTSGGLLAAVDPDKASEVLETLRASGITDAAVVGHICADGPGKIAVGRSESLTN